MGLGGNDKLDPFLEKEKKSIFHLSEQTRIEVGIGWTVGILIGMLGAAVAVIFFSQMQLIFKILSIIGFIGIIGQITMSLFQQFKIRKQYIASQEALKEMLKEFEEKPKDNQNEELKGGQNE